MFKWEIKFPGFVPNPYQYFGPKFLTLRGLKVLRLRSAMVEYEQDRWRMIATKVGNGFSPAACKEKAKELEGE